MFECIRTLLLSRFLVDIRWMKQWKKYVGYYLQDQSSAGKESASPGPLDNSRLLTGTSKNAMRYNIIELKGNACLTFIDGSLRDGLTKDTDYCLLPESAWNKLFVWYGISSGSKVILRCVKIFGHSDRHCIFLLSER